jgi:hypothetical protein
MWYGNVSVRACVVLQTRPDVDYNHVVEPHSSVNVGVGAIWIFETSADSEKGAVIGTWPVPC